MSPNNKQNRRNGTEEAAALEANCARRADDDLAMGVRGTALDDQHSHSLKTEF